MEEGREGGKEEGNREYFHLSVILFIIHFVTVP